MNKGIIVYYVNRQIFVSHKEEMILKIITNSNKLFVESCEKDGYTVLFVPVENEASKVEKIDF